MLAVALAVIALGLPATAAAAPNVKLKASDAKNGPFVNAPGPNPFDVSTDGTNPKNLYIKASLADEGAVKVRLYERLCCAPGTEDYQLRWFAGRRDISHDAQTAGYLFRLRHGHPKVFRIRIKPEVPGPGDFCLFPLIEKNSSMNDLAEAFFAINNPNACV